MGDLDLVIRGGTIVDGSGTEPYVGDVGVRDGRIVAVGEVGARARKEVDAQGLLVTPGFVDIHTHYDGQAIWSDRLNPSSAHGVTTAMIGNCGVGFAPCRKEDHDALIRMMEGVEDIPGAVMAEGLSWDWETFPEYMDALAARQRDIDVAVLLPHSPLRVYAMGPRGAAREQASAEDLQRMAEIARDAARAGAIGFGTSRTAIHRTSDGHLIPSFEADLAEIEAIMAGMHSAGLGRRLLQVVPRGEAPDSVQTIGELVALAERTQTPMTLSMGHSNAGRERWEKSFALVAAANARGAHVRPQMFPRPIGLIIGLDMSVHPFSLKPSYIKIAHLPLSERVRTMRDPAVKAAIVSEELDGDNPLRTMSRAFGYIFPMDALPNYEPDEKDCVAAQAKARGVSPEECMYDLLLEDEGRRMFFVALTNYPGYSLDGVAQAYKHEHVIPGLGDGGAHYGMICDSSYTTFMLQHWARDRKRDRLSIQKAIQLLTADTAEAIGLKDRGRLAPGLKADLNLIDHAKVRLHAPRPVFDLPAGGRRLDQRAEGYVATYVAGRCIARNGEPTAERPGALVRAA